MNGFEEVGTSLKLNGVDNRRYVKNATTCVQVRSAFIFMKRYTACRSYRFDCACSPVTV